ncbi:MAG: AAA family ATPase [Candidatus Woykebacteria bacterium]
MNQIEELPNLDILAEDNIRTLHLPKNRLVKPLAVTFVGIPAAGKTSLTNTLAQALPLAVLSEEEMLKFLAPRLTFFERGEERILSLATKTMEALIARGISCIFDHNVKKKAYRDYIRKVVEKAAGASVLVYVDIPKEVAYKQLSAANYQVSRGDKKGVIMNKDLFEYEVASTEIPTTDEHPFVYQPKNAASLNSLIGQISKFGGMA